MNDQEIAYVIHIVTTAEELWKALTDTDILRKNWGRIESRWTVGSEVTEVGERGELLWKGKVLKSDPPRLLSYTMEVIGIKEPPTEVKFELSPPLTEVGQEQSVVRLKLTQSGFSRESKLAAECARAWSEILSSIKTYMESGRPIRFLWKH